MEDAVRDQDLVDKNRFWLSKNESSLDELPIDAVDVVAAIESSKTWEELGQPRLCSLCKEVIGGECLHCDNCQNFQVCLICSGTDHFAQLQTDDRFHGGHSFIQITYRPIAAPIYDGGDLALLRRFANVSSEKEFYLYFPFFMHDIEGMDRFVAVNRKALKEYIDPSRSNYKQLMESINFPTDWFARIHGHGEWRGLHNSVMKIFGQKRIQCAEHSVDLSVLLKRLQDARATKERIYGIGDIPPTTTALTQAAAFNSLISADASYQSYLAYTLPIHLGTELNSQIDNANLKGSLPRESFDPIYRPMTMLFNLFGKDQERQTWSIHHWDDNITSVKVYLLKDKYVDTISKHMSIRRSCIDLEYDNLPMLKPSTLETFKRGYRRWKDTYQRSATARVVSVSNTLVRKGEFQQAAGILRSYDCMDPHIALALHDVYAAQGYLNRLDWHISITGFENAGLIYTDELGLNGLTAFNIDALRERGMDYIEAKRYVSDTLLARAILRLAATYETCRSAGEWQPALKKIRSVWGDVLIDWRESDIVMKDGLWFLLQAELYYHRVSLAALRDQYLPYDGVAALKRLDGIRKALEDVDCFSEAWEVLVLQLDIAKSPCVAYYLEIESSFSVNAWNYNAKESVIRLSSFLNYQSVSLNTAPYEFAQAELVLAEILDKSGDGVLATKLWNNAYEAFKSFSVTGGGIMDAHLSRFERTGYPAPSYGTVQAMYRILTCKDDMARLRRLRAVIPRRTNISTAGDLKWRSAQRASLAELAFQAGEDIVGHRWRLRRYAGDTWGNSLISESEKPLCGIDAPQSGLLLTIASFNLARAYLVQKNHYDALAYAILHNSLVTCQASDAERSQRAQLLVLEAVTQAFESLSKSKQKVALLQLTESWNGWLNYGTPERWANQGARVDEIDRFIDGMCFLARLAGMAAPERISDIDINEDVIRAVLDHLSLALDLYESLPTYAISTQLPRIATAIGSAAQYVGNKELACRSYSEGLQACHSGDLWSSTSLRFLCGSALVKLTAEDPEHWSHVLREGRSMLTASSEGFARQAGSEKALTNCCQALLSLLESFVTEARGLKWFFHRGIPDTAQREESSPEEKRQLERQAVGKIEKIVERTEGLSGMILQILSDIRDNMTLNSRFESMRNARFITSGSIAKRTLDLQYELAWIVVSFQYHAKSDTEVFHPLWSLVQARKSMILIEQVQQSQSAELLQNIMSTPRATELYRQEQELIQEGPQGMGDNRLKLHRASMREVPELRALLDNRKPQAATIESLKPLMSIAANYMPPEEHVILVDWAEYGDCYFVLGFDVTLGKLLFGEILARHTVDRVKKWIEEHLDTTTAASSLGWGESLQSLHELVKPLAEHVPSKSLLVFSPAQKLHRVPLHAIPLKANDPFNLPVIYYHPVIYCPSAAVFGNLVVRSLKNNNSLFQSAICGRYETASTPRNATVVRGMEEISARFESAGATSKLVTGNSLTFDNFTGALADSHLIHFHGHSDGQKLEQLLELECLPIPTNLDTKTTSNTTAVRNFQLQDAFTISLRHPAVILLIACGSGKQDVALNDDALGLLTAFFTAGATSIVGTLWPIDSHDGLEFTKYFYEESFWGGSSNTFENIDAGGEESNRRLINLAKAMQKAVLAMRADDSDLADLYDDDDDSGPGKQMQPREAWRWAGYVLQGSWLCRSI